MADATDTQTFNPNQQGLDVLQSLLQQVPGIAGAIGKSFTQGSPSVMGMASQGFTNTMQPFQNDPRANTPQIGDIVAQATMNHPDTHAKIEDTLQKTAANTYASVFQAALDKQLGTVNGKVQIPGSGQEQPQEQSQQQVQQAPTGINPQAIQQLQQLLGIHQQPQPGFFDRLARLGGIETPAMAQAMAGAQAQGAMGPEVVGAYAKGQLPLTTEQGINAQINMFKAKQEVMNQSLQREQAYQDNIQKQIDTRAKEFRNPLAKFGGASTSEINALQQQILDSKIRQTTMQHQMDIHAGLTKELEQKSASGKSQSQQQEQYRMTSAGNKFKLK